MYIKKNLHDEMKMGERDSEIKTMSLSGMNFFYGLL